MATSLSNETSTTSLMELSQNPTLSGIQSQDCSYGSTSKTSNAAARSDNNGFSSSVQGANAMTSSSQNSSASTIKSRGESITTSQSYQQQQSSLMQGIQYPFLYPSQTSYLGFPQPQSSSQYNYSNSGVGNANMTTTQASSATANNRRGGKKKTPATQSQNPELRFFFNLRRRDSQTSTSKGQSHVYKLKNPPSISEWFKRLSIEERVNALSTVCPHLTETFTNMLKKIEESGYGSFARKTGPNSQDQKYFSTPSYLTPYQQSISSIYNHSSSNSSMSTFDENFYCRVISDTEMQLSLHSDGEQLNAEKEIFNHVRLTDYCQQLDTLTVQEEFVQDADYFFKLMSYATKNQAFQSSCQFETKGQNTVIEQPSWFKPNSFHSFATWIIVALEENLWAHYNNDNTTNMGTAKTNDIATLFREKTDMGAQDVDLLQLSQYWKDTSEIDKKALIDTLISSVLKEVESEYNSGHTKSHKVVNTKSMNYSVNIKEKPEKQTLQEQVEQNLQGLIDESLRSGAEQELLTKLIYTTFDRCASRQVNINRKFLEIIKKKFKDDLMENLLQEEYQSVKSSKQFKKKKKKNFNSNNQQSSQAVQPTGPSEKGAQSSAENIVESSEITQIEDQTTKQQLKGKKNKNKGKQSTAVSTNVATLITSQEQAQPAPITQLRGKKKKNNQNNNFRNIKDNQQQVIQQDPHSCDDQQPAKINVSIEKDEILESDNKNSSLDTKSSSNLFDLATAHQSNNSNTNSSVTIKSGSNIEKVSLSNKAAKTANQNGLQINSSKSLELNAGLKQKGFSESLKIKQQKNNSNKVESKNYQILQNSSNQEAVGQKNKNDDKKSKNNSNIFSESQIFSEDDAKRGGQSFQETETDYESMELIKSYVLELTNSMINEVCRRFEVESPARPIEEVPITVQSKAKSTNLTQVQKSIQESDEYPQSEYLHLNSKMNTSSNSNNGNNQNRQFGKNKQRKESNLNNPSHKQSQANHEVVAEDKSNRKKSFNAKKYVKEDKKFTEDYADNTSQLLMQSNSAEINESQLEAYSNSTRKSSQTESTKGGQHQRKGFGIHLKGSEKQQEQQEIRAVAPSNNNTAKHEKNQAWAKGTARVHDSTTGGKKKGQNQKKQSETNNEQDSQAFLKSSDLKNQTSIESAILSSNKEDSISSSQLNKKKRNKKKSKLTDIDIMNNFMKNLHSQTDDSKSQHDQNHASSSQSYKKKSHDNPRQVPLQRPSQPKQQQQQIAEVPIVADQLAQKSEQQPAAVEDNKSQQKSSSHKQKYTQKNSQPSLSQQISTDSKTQLVLKPEEDEQPQQATAPQDQSHNNSQQTSMYQVKKNSTGKLPKPHLKHPRTTTKQQEPVVDDKESVNSNKADSVSDDRSSKSQNDKPLNPDHQLNARSAAFRHLNFQGTPVDSDNASFTDLTGTTNTAVNTSLENNASTTNSKYQSYQNTPIKPTTHHPKNYQKQNAGNQLQMNEQESASFRTPPQLSKKQGGSQTSYSHHGGNFRSSKHHSTTQHSQSYASHQPTSEPQYPTQPQGYNPNHSGANKNSQRTSQGYNRQASRPTPSNVYVQQMNLSQSMQEQRQYMQTFMNPENNNIFYQDQSMLVNLNPNVDNKPQEGIFQYVEKNAMILQQPIPCYSPSQYPVNQYVPVQQNQQEIIPNPFSYQHQQRMHVPYYDQSQELIFQIFNSIKSNHSMSPIPQMMSPPPHLDYQLSQSSELSLQAQRSDSLGGYNHQELAFHQVFDNEIETFNKAIEDNLYSLKPERDYLFNKLSDIAHQVFIGQQPKLVLFGSLITGLALESSDMDLAVTRLVIDDRFVMVQDLNKLAQALQDWNCLESFKSIETASIPVIKMKVDLVKLRQNEMKDRDAEDFLKRPISEEQRYLSVDITFDDTPVSSNGNLSLSSADLCPTNQTKTHLGLQSCALVQQYIAEFKNLKPVAILLKKFLAIQQLNSPYYGGISSYSTVLLIVAYMNYYGLRGNHELSPSRLLMGFLDFYGHYFNPSALGISVYDEGLLDSNFMILDPLNLQNNTTKNSYHTKEILLKFQCAFNNLKSLMFKLPLLQQTVISSQTVFLQAFSQDQKSSIPNEKASPQPSSFQTHDSNIQSLMIMKNQYQQNDKIEVEDGSDGVTHRIVPEEYEASNLALGAIKDSQIKSPLICQVSLLETFFIKDAQPATDLSGLPSSQTEPRGTQITMIEEAQVQ